MTALAAALRPPADHLVDRARRTTGEWLAATTRLDLVVLMTLVLFIDGGPGRPVSLVKLVCFAGLLYRPVTRLPAFWLTLTALWVVFFLPRGWPEADNHQWLIVYWSLALGLAMLHPDPLRVLATSARVLIGLVFALATAWKIASPDFPDGDFFAFTLVTDARFTGPAEVLGGLPDGAAADNRAAIEAWDDPAAGVEGAAIVDGPRTAAMAQVMAVGTIALEGLVAVAFLVPQRTALARAREGLLLLFLLATYPIAPVASFGWTLAAMGLAQSRLRRGTGELAYATAFLAIFAFTAVDVVWEVVGRVLA